jgi:hypothetical protein
MPVQKVAAPRQGVRYGHESVAAPVVLGDFRYRALLGTDAWQALAPDVQRRFSKRLSGGESALYSGHIEETAMNRTGWLLAQFCRLIGSPLPLERGGHGRPAVVTVTEDRDGGQFWTRQYGRSHGFPQIVHSAKRFSGPTGLEEYIGFGIGIALTILERDGALIFRSRSYFLRLFGRRIGLPALLSPGRLEVGHHDRGGGTFAFTLDLVHPLFGALIRQTVKFHDTKETSQ